MKHFTTKLMAVCVLLAMAGSAQAQVFYQELFDGSGLPAGWTTADPSGNGVLWVRCDDPATDCHADLGYDLFAGSDKDNGFMVVDSDGAGDLAPGTHQAQLTTGAINCTGKAQVFATFEHQIGVFDYVADDNAKLFVSNNGTTWTAYQLFEGVTGNTVAERFSDNPVLSGIDISAVAANQATVYLRWEWIGNYEYWWTLDKVELTTIDPSPANDLAVADFFYPVSSYATPESQIGTDTFAFVGYVSNKGTQTQTNVKLYAYVLQYNPTSGALIGIVHADSTVIPALASGVDSFEIEIGNRYAPELPVGLYAVAYEVVADSADQVGTDNFVGDFFEVTELVFAKEDGPQTASRPADGGDWAVGNYYRMGPSTAPLFKAAGAEFTFAVNAPMVPGDIDVEISLYKINDDVLEDFSNFEPDGSSMVLLGSVPFNTPDNAENYELFSVEIFDFNTAELGIPLEPNGRYLLAAGYVGESADAFTAFNGDVRADFVSTILYIGGQWGGNFVGSPNAVLRMYLDMIIRADEEQLPEVAMAVTPNPTADFVNLKLKFEEPTEATIIIGDMSGRVIRTENRVVLDETVTYRMPELASGTYIARIVTDKGTRTLNFVVQK